MSEKVDKKDMKFEDAVRSLEKIISELESGELDLDKSISEYSEAMKLIEFCEKKLNSATKTVNKLVEANGKIVDFEVEE
ncbi:MAG: exodeoxyribonuclease VII small subunit [bacterium]|nr:exodeoxyribonuclease VII small subunit [bacterium]